MFLKSFISSCCVYHDKTGLKCYIWKPAGQAGQESRISPAAKCPSLSFSWTATGVSSWERGYKPHPGVTPWCSSTVAALAVQHWCMRMCVSLPLPTGNFDTITFLPLPVCHLLTFHLHIKICCFCFTCHVRGMLNCCWPWDSHGEQASHWHCFTLGRHAGERSWMGGHTPLKGPRSESFYDSSGMSIWIWGKPGHQGWPASCQVPALLPTQGHLSQGEKRCRSPLCKEGRLLPSSLGIQSDRKRRILVLMVLTT